MSTAHVDVRLLLYWSWLLVGLGGVVARASALGLEWRGNLEYTGEDEERILRSKRLLAVREGPGALRGCGKAPREDETPSLIKFLTLAAALAWCMALPVGNAAQLPVEVRSWFLWAAVVPTAAAAFCYAVYRLRLGMRLVSDASEDR